MNMEIRERCKREASYMIETGATVRQTANKFDVSKTTVHKDVADRIWEVDWRLACAVADVLDLNLAERHIRGGKATKARWEVIKSKK